MLVVDVQDQLTPHTHAEPRTKAIHVLVCHVNLAYLWIPSAKMTELHALVQDRAKEVFAIHPLTNILLSDPMCSLSLQCSECECISSLWRVWIRTGPLVVQTLRVELALWIPALISVRMLEPNTAVDLPSTVQVSIVRFIFSWQYLSYGVTNHSTLFWVPLG